MIQPERTVWLPRECGLTCLDNPSGDFNYLSISSEAGIAEQETMQVARTSLPACVPVLSLFNKTEIGVRVLKSRSGRRPPATFKKSLEKMNKDGSQAPFTRAGSHYPKLGCRALAGSAASHNNSFTFHQQSPLRITPHYQHGPRHRTFSQWLDNPSPSTPPCTSNGARGS